MYFRLFIKYLLINTKCLDFLIKNGSNIQKGDFKGITPLHLVIFI